VVIVGFFVVGLVVVGLVVEGLAVVGGIDEMKVVGFIVAVVEHSKTAQNGPMIDEMGVVL